MEEVSFLRTHFTLAQGMRGETIIRRLTSGTLAAKYAQTFDLKVGDEVNVEIKFSKLNTPVPGMPTRRWNWSKPLGWKDKGKDFHFLVLVGEKDWRYAAQYPDSSPYVFFVIPKQHVPSVCTRGDTIGANVQILTNLAVAQSAASLALKQHLVSVSLVDSLLQAQTSNSQGGPPP